MAPCLYKVWKLNFSNLCKDYFVNTYFSYNKFNGTFSFYIDGKESVKNSGINIEDTDFFDQTKIIQNLRIGNYLENESPSFSGKITDVNVWSQGLSGKEIIKWSNCKWEEIKTKPDIGTFQRLVLHVINILYHFS